MDNRLGVGAAIPAAGRVRFNGEWARVVMATIKDVAKLAQVSTATVSAALNGTAYVSPQLKERVERAILALGYSTDGIARSLKKGTSNLIGLLVDDVTSPFYTELVEEIESLAYREGYAVLLCHTGRDAAKERKYLSLLRTHRVAGIVWAPTGADSDYPESDFRRFAIPLVFVDRVVSTFQAYDSVLLDNQAAGYRATNYLLDLGHRRIAMVSGPEFLAPARERNDGYRIALRKRGLPVEENRIRDGAFREAEAFEECRKLLAEEPRVSAIVVANNPMFIGFMRALKHFGLSCPQDISVVAIDDFPLAAVLNPALSTVRQPIQEIAKLAVDLLLRRLSGDPPAGPTHRLLEPMLIVRDSCAPVEIRNRA
jgi:LacI family transcriptional regulator